VQKSSQKCEKKLKYFGAVVGNQNYAQKENLKHIKCRESLLQLTAEYFNFLLSA
jgi:hypothetical protein